MATKTPRVFISYQLRDMPLFVNLIYQSLSHKLGKENVFMDSRYHAVDADWHDDIEEAIQESQAMLVVIGPKWCGILNQHLEQFHTDWVLEEINLALKYNKKIVPILIGGANIPCDLPTALEPLRQYQPIYINTPREWLDLQINSFVGTL